MENRFNSPFRNRSLRLPNKKLAIYAGVAVAVILLFLLGKSLIGKNNNVVGVDGQKVQVQDAKSKKDVNYELQIPIKDSKGAELTKVKYTIQNVELRDEIVIKGKRGTAVAGRTFLILNLKLDNNYSQGVEINTKDFVRLASATNDQEWLAPEIHNDPVSVQAISTKYSRVGFPVNDSDKNFKLQIGEIKGQKQIIDLNF